MQYLTRFCSRPAKAVEVRRPYTFVSCQAYKVRTLSIQMGTQSAARGGGSKLLATGIDFVRLLSMVVVRSTLHTQCAPVCALQQQGVRRNDMIRTLSHQTLPYHTYVPYLYRYYNTQYRYFPIGTYLPGTVSCSNLRTVLRLLMPVDTSTVLLACLKTTYQRQYLNTYIGVQYELTTGTVRHRMVVIYEELPYTYRIVRYAPARYCSVIQYVRSLLVRTVLRRILRSKSYS